ncbi:MAG: rod-binding protein [Planctomycetes bacterium]|nr:rod-binding protein [Planctomycetota bacterium]
MTSAVNNTIELSAATQQDLRRLREATRGVAGSVFYGQLLKTMRDSSIKGTYGHGGRGEEVFAAQLHAELADRMGQATRVGLSEALYRRFEEQQIRVSVETTLERSTT